MKDIFKLIAQILAVLFLFATPLIWLGVTADPASWPKNVFLVAIALVLILLFALDQIVSHRGLKITNTPFSLPLILLAASYWVSMIFAPNQVEAAVLPMGTASITALVIIFLITTGPLWKENRWLTRANYIAFSKGAIIAGLIAFVSFSPAISLPARPFITTGPIVALIVYLTASFLGGMVYLIASFAKHRGEHKRLQLAAAVMAGFTFLVIVLNLWKLWPARIQYFTFLPTWSGWQIAAESLKVSPLWGRGPVNFLTAFTTGRPVALNRDPFLWNIRFFVSTNYPFHLASTVGLFGLAAYGFLVFEIAKTIYQKRKAFSATGWGLAAVLVAVIIGQLITPPTLVTWWTLFAALMLFTFHLRSVHSSLVETKDAQEVANLSELPLVQNIINPKVKTIASVILGIVLILIVIPTGYFTYRATAAEIAYKKAIDEAVTNKGEAALDQLTKAISLNPFIDTYHLGASQVNLAMANSLATTKGKDLTEDDRKLAIKYVQTAIEEGKKATEIGPKKVTNWDNLSALYRNLFYLANGADRFALSAIEQSIALDPTNPTPRLSQGGTYYAMGDYDMAIVFFKQAIELKTDWANAHYNLSAALREKKDYQGAIGEMEKTLALVPTGSDDASKASAELDALKQAQTGNKSQTEKPKAGATAQSILEKTLEKPTPIPTPVIKPALDVSSISGIFATSSSSPQP